MLSRQPKFGGGNAKCSKLSNSKGSSHDDKNDAKSKMKKPKPATKPPNCPPGKKPPPDVQPKPKRAIPARPASATKNMINKNQTLDCGHSDRDHPNEEANSGSKYSIPNEVGKRGQTELSDMQLQDDHSAINNFVEKLQLQQLREDMKKQRIEYEEKLKEKDHKLTTTLEELREKDCQLITLMERTDKLTKAQTELGIENYELKKEKEKREENLRQMKAALQHQEKGNKELKESAIKLAKSQEEREKELKQKNEEILKLNQRRDENAVELKNVNKKLKKQVLDLENELKQNNKTIRDLESEVDVKVEKIQDLRQQRKELKDELRWWTKIECPIIIARGRHPSDAAEELLNQAVSQLSSKDVKVMSKDSSSVSRRDGVIVVPCIISSRVETDIDACLSQLQLPPGVRVVLIVFQHVAKENSRLPAMSTDERLAAKFQQCDVIYDAHFWQGQFYRCKVNDLFMDRFEKFLTRS